MNLADQLFVFDRFSEREGFVAVDGLIVTKGIGLLRKWDGAHAAIIARTEFDLDNERGFV